MKRRSFRSGTPRSLIVCFCFYFYFLTDTVNQSKMQTNITQDEARCVSLAAFQSNASTDFFGLTSSGNLRARVRVPVFDRPCHERCPLLQSTLFLSRPPIRSIHPQGSQSSSARISACPSIRVKLYSLSSSLHTDLFVHPLQHSAAAAQIKWAPILPSQPL